MKRILRNLFFATLIGGLSFLLSRFFEENSDPLQAQLMGWRTKPIGTGLFVALTFFIGFFLSFILTFTAVVAKSIEAGRLRRENLALQKLLEDKTNTHSSSSKT